MKCKDQQAARFRAGKILSAGSTVHIQQKSLISSTEVHYFF